MTTTPDTKVYMYVGVTMPLTADVFKAPVIPGWRMVAFTRQPFGAACIMEKISLESEPPE